MGKLRLHWAEGNCPKCTSTKWWSWVRARALPLSTVPFPCCVAAAVAGPPLAWSSILTHQHQPRLTWAMVWTCPCLLLLGFALDSAFPWARGPVLPKPSQCGSAQPPSCPVLPASLSEPAPTTLTGHPPGPLSACPVDPAWLFQPTRLQVPGLSSLGNTVTSMPQQTRSHSCHQASQLLT